MLSDKPAYLLSLFRVFTLCLMKPWLFSTSLRKHANIILTPLNSTFIQENWDLQGYILFFLFLLKHIDCGYSLELPHQGGSNE